jgi:glutaconate CoA-transferase subunit B
MEAALPRRGDGVTKTCSLGEMMITALSRTIEDGTLVFHGFGSPLVQLAMHVAKRTHAPRMVLVAGATYGIDPDPPFLAPTTNDWVMDRGASSALGIEELFDLAAAGRMGRMFLSGLQIDRWGNCNVTSLGFPELKMKLPGGGGGCNLSCDAAHLTLWTTAHRALEDAKGRRRFRLADDCDFITNLGHRTKDGKLRRDLGHRGNGPQWLVTELGLFDFDDDGHMRLNALYPDTSVEDVLMNTGFKPRLASQIEIIPPPERLVVEFIRRLDPLKVHEKEIRAEDMRRRFTIA